MLQVGVKAPATIENRRDSERVFSTQVLNLCSSTAHNPTWNGKQDALLALEDVGQLHAIAGVAFLYFNVRQFVTNLQEARVGHWV